MAPVNKTSGLMFWPKPDSPVNEERVATSQSSPVRRSSSPIGDEIGPRRRSSTASGTITRAPRQVLQPGDLSSRKQAYLANRSKGPQRISIEKLGTVADHKSAKNGIEIQVNGDGAALRRAQADWRTNRGINQASPDDIHDAAKRLDGKIEPIFQEQLDGAARQATQGGRGVRDLRPLDSEAFKAAVTSNPALRGVFTDEVSQAVGLSPAAAVDDMTAVSARATREARAIGYAFTSRHPMDATGVAKGDGHTDSYIMAPSGRVLNLIPYPTAGCEKVRDGLLAKNIPFASADLSRFIQPYRPVNPQADAASCNSLAVSQMNQYQKDDARQLKECSLVVSGLKDGKAGDFMLPSPQALFFSQSTLPLKIADAMVRGGSDTAQVEHDGQSYAVPTLRGLARDGARCEAAFGGSVHDLDAFRATWCMEMDKMQDKRDALNYAQGTNVQNGALAQASRRHAESS